MSARQTSILSRRPSAPGDPVEIDVTPVMNMFIILIPFLVSMAVFTHLATHAVSLPADGSPGDAQLADQVPLTVAVATDRILVLQGDVEITRLEVAAGGAVDAAVLRAVLTTERARRPQVGEVVVAVDDGVDCAGVVRCLDQCQAAGFTDVGLAAGTNLDRAAAGVTP